MRPVRRLTGTLCALGAAFGAAAWLCASHKSKAPPALNFVPGASNIGRRSLVQSPLEATAPAERVARPRTGSFTGGSLRSTKTSTFSGLGLCAAIMVLVRSSIIRSAEEGREKEASTLEGDDFVGFKTYLQQYGTDYWKELAKKNRSKQDKNLGYRITPAPGYVLKKKSTPPVRWAKRMVRRQKLRKRYFGTPARPRVAVYRAHRHFYVNIVDDTIGTGVSLLMMNTQQRWWREELRKEGASESEEYMTHTVEAAERLAKQVAAKMLEKGINVCVIDRGGFPYQGRVQAFAEALRMAGVQV